MIAYNIRINSLEKRTSHSDIVLTTGDVKGYKFKFAFDEHEPEISFMTLKAKRADGEVVVAGADTFEIVLPSDMYSIPGDIAFEVALHDADGGCVTVQVITAFVREGFGEDGIESDDRYPILTTLINDVSGYKDVLEKLTDENGYLTDDAIADGSIGEEKIEKNLQEKINAQPDWNEQDESSAAYINNKPDIDGEIREVLAGQIDVGYMTINPTGRINTPAIYIDDGLPDWAGLIQYDEHGNEITMEQTLATKAADMKLLNTFTFEEAAGSVEFTQTDATSYYGEGISYKDLSLRKLIIYSYTSNKSTATANTSMWFKFPEKATVFDMGTGIGAAQIANATSYFSVLKMNCTDLSVYHTDKGYKNGYGGVLQYFTGLCGTAASIGNNIKQIEDPTIEKIMWQTKTADVLIPADSKIEIWGCA